MFSCGACPAWGPCSTLLREVLGCAGLLLNFPAHLRAARSPLAPSFPLAPLHLRTSIPGPAPPPYWIPQEAAPAAPRVVLTRPAQLQPGWLPPPLRLGTSSEVTDDSLADANHVLLGDATAGPHQVRGVLPGLHLCLRSCGSLDKDLPCVEGLMNLHPLAGSESGGRNCPFSPGQTAPQKRRWEPYQQLPKP